MCNRLSAVVRRLLWSAVLLLGGAGPAVAQTGSPTAPRLELHVGSGLGSLWDDETMLGRGAPLQAGVGLVLRERLLVTGSIDWLHHTRDRGYLAASGDLAGAFARAAWLFRDPSVRMRPLLGAGVGVMHSTGELRFSSFVPGPEGRPVPGPVDPAPWTITRPGYDAFAALRIRAGNRVLIRPEVGWRLTLGSSRATLEQPLMHVRTLVHLDIRLR